MNEQLQLALAAILDKTLNGIDAGVDFMQVELPDVIEQLLMWYMFKGVALFCIGAILVVLYFFALSRAYNSRPADGGENLFWERWSHKKNNEFSFGWTMCFASGGCVIVIPSIVMMSEIFESLQIWIAPKIWLIEYAASLAK